MKESDLVEFVKGAIAIVSVGGKKYFHFPYWFLVDENGTVEKYHVSNLTDELKNAIESAKNPDVVLSTKDRIEAEARLSASEYADATAMYGVGYYRGLIRGYINGATSENKRSREG